MGSEDLDQTPVQGSGAVNRPLVERLRKRAESCRLTHNFAMADEFNNYANEIDRLRKEIDRLSAVNVPDELVIVAAYKRGFAFAVENGVLSTQAEVRKAAFDHADFVISTSAPLPPNVTGSQKDAPIGAVENGREFLRRLADHYSFECEGGPLRNCSDFIEVERCFEAMAEWISFHASPLPPGPGDRTNVNEE